MKNINYILLHLGRLCIAALFFFAAKASALPYHFHSLTNTDGLSDLLVNTIYKDSRGYVWFGTSASLDRFDGNAIKTFDFPGDNLLLKRVTTIDGTPGGDIYVGNRQGLFRVDPGSEILVPVLDKEINFAVNMVKADADGRLYIATEHGLYIYDTATGAIRRILLQSDILSKENEISAIYIDSDNKIWVTTATSLYRVDPVDGSNESYRFPFPSSHCTAIVRFGANLYISTLGTGLINFDTATGIFGDIIHVGNNLVSDISLHGDTLYIATDGEGLYTYTGGTPRRFDAALRSKSVYSLLVDDNELLWVGYYQAGVDYTPYVGDIFEKYHIPGTDHDTPMTVRSLYIDHDSKLIGTREGLYYVDETTRTTRHFRSPEIRSNIIFCITYWRDRYYIGTYGGGLYELDPATRRISESDMAQRDLSNQTIFALKIGPDGDMWAGTSAGLFKFHDGHVDNHYTSFSSQLPAGNVYEVFFDSHKRGWLCTESGVAVITDGIIRSDKFPQGFINKDKIRYVYEDSGHTLYFLPDRGDVFTSNIDLTDFKKLRFAGSQSTMTTFAIEDRDGYIWFGTDRGIIRYDKESHTHLFNRADGLPGPIFTLCPPAHGKDGDLWFGNSDGLVRLDYRSLDDDRLHPEFAVTDMMVNGRSITNRIATVDQLPAVRLKESENDLTFCFSNFRYIETADLVVEYCLDGYDDEWKLMQGNASVTYYDLPPGDYRLVVRTPGVKSQQTLMTVRIDDEINWLIIILSLIVLGVSVWAGNLYIKHRHKTEELQRHQQEEQAAIAMKKQNLYKTTRLSAEECRRIQHDLDKVMTTHKPYTNPDLKSQALAEMIGVSTHDLSFFFNQYLDKSYYDYINEYRVNEFKRVAAEVDVSKYTLTALSQMCGFSSRASFFRHFKAITGITPAEYLKRD